jgi:hypothetical protein
MGGITAIRKPGGGVLEQSFNSQHGSNLHGHGGGTNSTLTTKNYKYMSPYSKGVAKKNIN